MEKIVKETARVQHGNAIWLGEWCSYIMSAGEESKDRWLVISKEQADGEFIEFNPSDSAETTLKREVIEKLADQKVKSIREQYGVLASDADTVAIAERILADLWDGVWMGHSISYYFYVDNLAGILQMDFLDAIEIVEILGQKKVVGLNGHILVPWKDENDSFSMLEKSTGHKRMSLGDFDGIWSCGYCQYSGDDFTAPFKDIPCVRNEDED